MKHFTEALRLVPGHAFAQRGVDEAPAPRKSSFLSRLRLSDRSESTPTDSTVVRPPQPREAFVSVAPDPGAPEDTTTVQAFEVLPRAPPPPAALIVPAPAGLGLTSSNRVRAHGMTSSLTDLPIIFIHHSRRASARCSSGGHGASACGRYAHPGFGHHHVLDNGR